MSCVFKRTWARSEPGRERFAPFYIALLISIFLQVVLALWILQVQTKGNETRDLLEQLEEAQTLATKYKADFEKLSQGPFKNEVKRKHFCNKLKGCEADAASAEKTVEWIQLVSDDKYNLLTKRLSATLNIWKVDGKGGDIYHEEGSIVIIKDGVYDVHVQMRLGNEVVVSEFVSYELRLNNSMIATTSWNCNVCTQSLSRLLHAKKGDRISVYVPWKNLTWFISNKITFFSAAYVGP